MNFDGFKKISTDHAVTVLQHPKGHEIRIARKSLSEKMRKGLDALPTAPKKLAKGGDIDTSAENEPATDLTGQEARNQSAKNLQMPQKMMKAIQSYPSPPNQQSFTQPTPDYSDIPLKENKKGGAPAEIDQNSQVSTPQQDPHEPVMMADGGPPIPPPADASPQDAPMSQGPAPASVPADPGQVTVDARMPPLPAPQAPNPNDPYGIAAYNQAQIDALHEQRLGALQENMAAADTAKRSGVMADTQATQQQQQLQAYHDDMQQSGQERQAMITDIQNGQIDPDHYINNMSTGKKLMTGIGLILGGMGSGAGRPDLAFESLQNNIKNDIQAQKDNLGSKESLLSNNLQNTQNLNKAMDMTNMQTQQIFASKLKSIADYGTQAAEQGKANQLAGMFDGKAAEAQHNMAVQNALLGANGANGANQNPEAAFSNRLQYLRMQGPDGERQAKTLQEYHMPGFANPTARPVQKTDVDQWQNLTNLQKLLNNAQDYLTKVGPSGAGYLRGNPATAAQGRSIQAGLTLEMGKFADLNRFTPEEHKLFTNRVPDLTGTHFTGQDQALMSQLQQEIGDKVDTFKSGLFGPQSSQGQSRQGAPPVAPRAGKSAPATGIRYMGGKPYKLDPTGKFMIPVK